MTSRLNFKQKSVAAAIAVGSIFLGLRTIYNRESLETNPFKEFNQWLNSFIVPESLIELSNDWFGEYGGHYFVLYVRNLLAGSFIYYFVNGLWHIYIYKIKGKKLFSQKEFPSKEVIADQILLGQSSMIVYAALPVFSEWLIEEGYTRVYFNWEEIGGFSSYLLFTALYLCLVECGIYWMHRKLHTNKLLYKYIHALHHKYNKPSMLTPWASVAFNPLDGILQACPYVLFLLVVPCHYLTHMAMVFFTAIWATNIHDALEGDSEPILGSKYHTVHHTHYHYNFGQFFIFCDMFWGTLRKPGKRVQ